MATSTDEEKINQALSKEVEEATPDEAPEQPEQPELVANEPAETTPAEEDKPTESEDQSASTFTKPPGYEWVKGNSLEEFNQNLLVAYENSTAEALRLRKSASAPAEPAVATPAAPAADPAIAYAQSLMQKDMIDSFNSFAKTYPQAREPQSFDQFEKASDGASRAFVAAFNRLPTYPELFEKTAQLLDWQPSDQIARKDAALKDTAASGGTTPASPAPAKRVTISAKQLEIARRIPGHADKSDAELVKELQPYIT